MNNKIYTPFIYVNICNLFIILKQASISSVLLKILLSYSVTTEEKPVTTKTRSILYKSFHTGI